MSPAWAEAARRLRDAYHSGAIGPLRDLIEPGDSAGAYAIQAINTRRWVADGRRIIGRKIGLTAEAVQRQFAVDQPDYGVLFDDMAVRDGGRLSASRMIQPMVEAEVAIVLGRDILSPEATPDDVSQAADHAVAAIEIVDSRIQSWRISLADTIADNGSSAFFVLGANRKRLEGLDLRACTMALKVNDRIVSTGVGAASMSNPLNAASWLVRTLAAAGEGLKAGDILLTGSLGPMAAVAAGDHVVAAIEGLGEASFTLSP